MIFYRGNTKIRYNIGLLRNIENIINVIIPYYDIHCDDDYQEIRLYIYELLNFYMNLNLNKLQQ